MSSVSKVLNDKPDISQETKKRVRKMADKLGYLPNLFAQSLVTKRSYMLGIIVPDLRISFFAAVAQGIYEHALGCGYMPIMLVTDEKPEIERRNLELLASLPVDGILLNVAPGKKNNDLLKSISKNIPVICYDRTANDLDFSSVTVNDVEATKKIIDFLVQNNRKKIAYLGPTKGLSVARDRFKGYREGLKKHNIPLDSKLTLSCTFDLEKAGNKIKQLLESGIRPDAVICMGGLLAYRAGQAILDAQLKIPQDIFLAEYGDNLLPSRLGVTFLTVNQFPYEIGKTAVDLLIDNISDRERYKKPKHVVLDTELIVRKVG